LRFNKVIFVCALFSLALTGCSWTVGFYIINAGSSPQTVAIELEKPLRGFMIFNPRDFILYKYTNAAIDFESANMLTRAGQSKNEIEIPPHSALQIGRLSNEEYRNSRQNFNNGRVFNLIRIRTGANEVTRETFDRYFRKISAGHAWTLPVD
jgi:hypothetical protein